VGYPGFDAVVSEESEVCADHVSQGIGSLVVGHDAMEEATVVVTVYFGRALRSLAADWQ
jgi:hypothetical protein